MSLRVLFYCPDQHIEYDGRTPDERGVGGGITARVRMSRALARAGHDVVHVGNCPRRQIFDGVEYVPLEAFAGASPDVLILQSSGGALDLSPATKLDLRPRHTILWVQGTDRPGGVEGLPIDVIVAPSRFVKDIVTAEWAMPASQVVVSYNGYEASLFDPVRPIERDPYRLIYCSHPSKGLQPAYEVLNLLRQEDARYNLQVLGGVGLWGGKNESPTDLPAGVEYHGLVGQQELSDALRISAFCMQLQNRLEPGALVVAEAKRAGCLLVASAVGVFPEQVTDEVNGLLVDGDAFDPSTWGRAAARILACQRDPILLERMRQRAQVEPASWDEIAADWIEDWQRRLGYGQRLRTASWR
jgi:glycosyltransferase involved in cell wall biosynthesis